MNSEAVSNLSRFISATKGYHFLLHLTHCTLLMSSSCCVCSVERILTSCTSSAWLKLKLKIWVKGQKTRLDFSTIEWLRISNVCRKEVCSSYAMMGLPLLSSSSTTPQGVLCWSILIPDDAQCKTTFIFAILRFHVNITPGHLGILMYLYFHDTIRTKFSMYAILRNQIPVPWIVQKYQLFKGTAILILGMLWILYVWRKLFVSRFCICASKWICTWYMTSHYTFSFSFKQQRSQWTVCLGELGWI